MDILAELVGESPGLVAVREKVGRLLRRQSDNRRLPPILLQGETGTGKGLLARALHRAGSRADGPFVDVNCAAIPDTLLEAELFGFERGAFTDARHAKPGLVQTAHRGTLFLDEVGLLTEGLQAKLLKVIEERVVRRLGSTRSEPVDVWVLSATSEDLVGATRARRFREDLYHRLAVLTLSLPPLRERGRDILMLGERALARACAEYDLPPKSLDPEARAALSAYPWPGNVRELGNVMERVALLAEASVVTAEMLALPDTSWRTEPAEPAAGPAPTTLQDAVGTLERTRLGEALRDTHWNVSRAADLLGITRDRLRYRIAKYGLRAPASPIRSRRAPPDVRAAPAATLPTPIAPGGAAGAVRWDRRRLAFLRAALVVPSASDARLYPSRALEVLVEKAESFGGRVEDLGPTGIAAVFGLDPIEDAPRRAAHAAMAIRKAAGRADAQPLAVKLGIHVDQFLVGQGGSAPQIDLDGKRQAWALLEALLARMDADTISVSEAATPLLERRFDLVPLGPLEGVRGQAYRLAGGERAGLGVGGRRARFVGRREELELLQTRLLSAVRGHGHVIGIVGEAGIGKSRLLFEFRRATAGERVIYLAGQCYSYGSAIPYLPVLQVFRRFCGIADGDGPAAVRQKVRLALEAAEMDAAEAAPYLLQFLGFKEGPESLAPLSSEAIRSRTLARLRQMVLQGSRRRPIVLVAEDLQWIDRSSEECLSLLVEGLAGARVLVLGTYRPGYRPPWIDKSYASQMALQPLSAEDSLSMLRSVARDRELPEPLAQLILAKAEGNPFFLEELARTVGEGAPPWGGVVPDTIEQVLRARIDRLPEEPRRLLQTASVLGREVSLGLLGALWDGPSLEDRLRELTRLEFLNEEASSAEPVYVFEHALTQEVAYQSLLPSDRRTLHAAVARALEVRYADRLAEACDRLAFHYSRAEQADKAVEHLTRLAEMAARRHAHSEAVGALEEALDHAERLPAGERDRRCQDLSLRQASSLIYLGRFQEALSLLLRRQAGLERLDDPALAGHYYFLLARTYLFLGDQERGVHSAHRAIAEASRCGDQATMGKAHYVLAQEAPLSGRTPEGIEHGQQALALLTATGQQWWIGQAHWALGLNHAQMGEFEPALAAEARASAIGEATEILQLQASAAWATGVIHAAMGEWEAGIVACQRALDLAPDPLTRAVAAGWLGYARVEMGDAGPAIPLLQQAVQLRFPQFQGWFTVVLAEAQRLHGELERALDTASQGLQITSAAKSLYGVGLAHRSLGRIARATGRLSEAEIQLNHALRTFEAMRARYDAARTHLDLAELTHAAGRSDGPGFHTQEAYDLFRLLRVPVYVARTRELAKELGTSLAEVRER